MARGRGYRMMFSHEIESFIRDFTKDLNEGTASIFAGAGLSLPAGCVSWPNLMDEIAQDLGLNILKEHDLISLAQYHVNEHGNKSKINRKILEEFTEGFEETENHRIISRLPFSSIWTTNYDTLIEKTLQKENKVVDVKYTNDQLLTTKPKRDIVVFKMHGDVNHPSEAILTKEQYEGYHRSHEPFINALTGELTTKTFLFIGFSFTDPNLDYVLSRLNFRYRKEKRQHYCFVKEPKLNDSNNPDQATLDYNKRKQALIINDLKRYGIKSLIINEYSTITDVLKEIESRFKKKTIFISGSAEKYSPIDKEKALGFIHKLSKKIIEKDFRIVNGFGWGIGSSVINGALEAIYSKPTKFSESQLILKPFPQFESGKRKLPELWEEYRQKMISLAGISIFIFGNKMKNEEIITADGVIKEFEISHRRGNICVPIAFTGYASRTIYDEILSKPEEYYKNTEKAVPILKELADNSISDSDKINRIITLLELISK